MSIPTSKSMTIYEGEDYAIRLEYNKQYVIFHLPYVHKMSKEVFQDMQFRLGDWHTFFSNLDYNGIWAAVDPDNDKINKLLSKLEFVFQGQADGMSVYRYGG